MNEDPREQSIRRALGLLRSVIQSGERWGEQCDEAYEQALDDLVSLMTELRAASSQDSEPKGSA